MDPIIKLEHITFGYEEEQEALSDISLELHPGRTYVLTGPNGCGKSTLFRILVGLEIPDEGQYLFAGENVTPVTWQDAEDAAAIRRRIGYIFQNPELQLFCKTVEDEIRFGLYQMELDKEEIDRRTEYWLHELGLEEIRFRAPFHLSGGEQKKTALAAILAMEPEILLLDEPDAGLDEDGMNWLSDFLKQLKNEKRLIVIATHDKALTSEIADAEFHMDRSHTILQEA